MNPARLLAVRSLSEIEAKHRYANLELDVALRSENLSRADKNLFTALLYGSIERRISLDFYISHYAARPLKSLQPHLLNLLRTALFQLNYLSNIPPRAVLFESAEIAKSLINSGASRFVTGVLRAALRDRDENHDPASELPLLRRREVAYSIPSSLLTLWDNAYGKAKSDAIAEAANTQILPTLRTNTLKTDSASLLKLLTENGIAAAPSTEDENAVTLTSPAGDLRALPGYVDGLFFVQDPSSIHAVRKLAPQPGEHIADVCAAPGGKSFSAAMHMENRGTIFSYDLHENKLSLIASGAKRLGVSILSLAARDARNPDPTLCGTLDRVLCDVPCSGLGVLAKKPDLRFKQEDDFRNLPEIQLHILSASARLLRPGAHLLYSTCTLNPLENERVTDQFLEEHPDFCRVLNAETQFPIPGVCDGFFTDLLQRKPL